MSSKVYPASPLHRPDPWVSLPQGVLPEGAEEARSGLLRVHAVLRHHGFHHREHAPAGGGGGRAGEQGRERLQHGPQHLSVSKPAVCQLDPEGKTTAAVQPA